MDRRKFLKLFGLTVAVIASESLPLLGLVESKIPTLYGDGIHDDTISLQALMDGNPVKTMDGTIIQRVLEDGIYTIYFPTGTFRITNYININANHSTIHGTNSKIYLDSNKDIPNIIISGADNLIKDFNLDGLSTVTSRLIFKG